MNPFAAAARLQDGRWNASFDGAKASRLLYDWAVGAFHPDREARWALRELRARARDLVRNNPYAMGIVEAFADNIVGWEGIRLKPQILGPDGEPFRPINWEIERAWREWGAPETASVDGQDCWLDIERLLVKAWVIDGEVFLRQRKGWSNAYGYAVEIIDADLLDETYNVPPDQEGIEIRMGVELDRFGRRLAYHFFREHPSLGRGRDRVRIPAEEVIHHFVRYRPGQTRGWSLFAPVLTTVKMIDGLTEAELVASRMAAATMGFVYNETPEAVAAYAQRLELLNERGEKGEPQLLDMAPGLISELIPGQRFQGFDPTHPPEAFEPFLKVMLRGVSRGFSVSYLTVTGDVADANYSSMRAGLLPERDHWRILQTVTAKNVHRRVYRGWVGTSLLTGALQLPSPIPSDYYEVDWRGRGWKWVDPKKEHEGHELEISLGVNSRQRIAAEAGLDYESVVDEIRDEEDYAAEQEVDVSVFQGKRRAGSEGGDEDDDEDADEGAAGSNRIRTLLTGSRNGKD